MRTTTLNLIHQTRARLTAEEGFTLMELIVVMLIIGIVTMIAVPEYVGFSHNAQQASAQSNVRTAVNAAEAIATTNSSSKYYYGNGTTLTGAQLRLQSPGIVPTVKATALNSGKGYCIEDTVATYTYSYIGGIVTSGTVGKIQSGTCLTDAGTAAS